MKFLQNTIVLFNSTCIRIIEAWEEACKRSVSMTYEPTLTSGMDGSHSTESGHYNARALDFRLRDVPFELREGLRQTAQEELGPDYLVILEATHYHIQRQKNSF